MKRAAVWLVFLVGCRFELPEAGIDAPVEPVDTQIDVGIDSPGCPANYAPLPGGPAGHVYLKVPQNGTWFAAVDFCRGTSARAYLAVPNNATELMNLYAVPGAEFWVGIDDRVTEGVYVSAETGSPATFLPWRAGEPNNMGDQDCVAALVATISDEFGTTTGPAVCECNP